MGFSICVIMKDKEALELKIEAVLQEFKDATPKMLTAKYDRNKVRQAAAEFSKKYVRLISAGH
jgi:hypothetical protein